MKVDQVPQDDENLFEGKLRELQYAVDDEGNYTTVKSTGWEPKNTVIKQAWGFIEEEIKEAWEEWKSGKRSPIYFYMKKQLMDYKTLAGYADIPRRKVRRHCKPRAYSKLNQETLQQYCSAFQLKNIEELQNPTLDD